jgi:hypothetical protein
VHPGRLLALVLLATLTLAAGCGGGDDAGGAGAGEGVEAEIWVEDVCTSLVNWRNRVEDRVQTLQTSVTGASGPAEARDQVAEFLGDLVSSTDELVSDIESAGVPSVDQGEAVARDLGEAVEGISQILASAREDVESTPLEPQALRDALLEIGTSIETEIESAGSAFDELQTKYDIPELDEAFEDEPACAEIQG